MLPAMRSTVLPLFAVLSLGIALPCVAADASAEALVFFREFEDRANQFDPALADLYSDDAMIKARRLYPTGRVQELTLSGDKWKALIRQAMPLAKARGDRNSFRHVSASPDSKQVTITAERHSHLKGYASPFMLIIRKQADGAWIIVEERTESRP